MSVRKSKQTPAITVREDMAVQLAKKIAAAFASGDGEAFRGAVDEMCVYHEYSKRAPVAVFEAMYKAMAMGASDVARKNAAIRNAIHKAAAIRQWRQAEAEGSSKAAFARSFAAALKREHGVDITPENIARNWLP